MAARPARGRRPAGRALFGDRHDSAPSRCALAQAAERPAHIDALLRKDASVERVPIQPGEVGDLGSLIDTNGDLRTLPCHLSELGGIDGFFAARLRRR